MKKTKNLTLFVGQASRLLSVSCYAFNFLMGSEQDALAIRHAARTHFKASKMLALQKQLGNLDA